MKKTLMLILILATLLLYGCGESISSSPSSASAYIGEEFETQISYDRWFSPFTNIEIISKCSEITISSEKVESSKIGSIPVKIKINSNLTSPKLIVYILIV